MLYTAEQTQLLEFVKSKVQNLFEQYPVTVHGFDHAERVANWSKQIATTENAKSVFLCELAGLLHDIGRVPEKYTEGNTKTHHELSYELLREWFRDCREFDVLTPEEKRELLYALRYHWCDAADEYEAAIILRDADKLDLMGEIGLERTIEWYKPDEKKIERDIQIKYYCLYWLRTDTAKHIAKEQNMFEPIDEYFRVLLKKQIKEIEI